MLSEKEIEIELQNKNLNAPRLTPQLITSRIKTIDYWVVPNTVVTVCALTLLNGFVVVGESAPVSKDNFDEGIGKRIAYDNAREQTWKLEGYLLKEKLNANS